MICNKASWLLLLFLGCILISCNHTIKGDMRRLLGTKVDISSLAMEYPGDGKELLYNPRASFKVIVYMDSLYCAECEVVKISVWNEHFHLFKSLGVPVYFVFNNNFKGNKLKDSFYLSSFDALRTFLIKNDTIVAIGNPILSSKVLELYSKVITTHSNN